jgi:putative membrane protein
MGLLSDDEKNQIAQAVAHAEQNTAGELVVVLTARSDTYAAWRAGLAGSLSVALMLEAYYVLHGWPAWVFFIAQLPLALLLYVAFGSGALLRLVVPKKALARLVEQRALAAFLEAGVTETRDRSGVLIFLSQAERRAVILADRGIHERVASDEWQKDIDDLIAAIRAGRPARGLLNAVERIGGILAESFPPREGDENELPNAVREVQ